MFRSLAAAGLAALSIATFSPAANADVDVRLFLGAPGPAYGNDCVWIGHRYKCYSQPMPMPYRHHHMRQDFFFEDDFVATKMSCSSAKELLYDRGFYHVKAKDCSGKNYGFKARRNGKTYYVTVNSWTGKMTASRV